MAKIVTQLGKSKKYANGSTHENASGSFQVLDRYLSQEGIVMLKIEWLTGDKAGQVEENREENINASIYKYEQSRGLLGNIDPNKEVVKMTDIYEELMENRRMLDVLTEEMHWRQNANKEYTKVMKDLTTQIKDIGDTQKILTTQLKTNSEAIIELTKVGSFNREMIKELGMMIEKNNTLIETVSSNVGLIQGQQKLIDKLIEKIG
jgi:hypothetical protein